MPNKNSRYWLFQAFGWGLFCCINVFYAVAFGGFNERFMQRVGLFVILGIIFTHLMREVVHKTNLLLKPLNRQIPGFLLLTFLTSVVISAIEVLAYIFFNLETDKDSDISFIGMLMASTFNSFIYIFFWNSIYFMYHYVTKSRKQQLDTLQLESLVKELELKTIKAHINPHFIFNSLNSIRALVDENPQRARQAITELSTILRSSMQADKSESVSTERELNIIKDYLALETMRFEDRLRVEFRIEPETLHMPVPPMMLQTLVENAIKHGISKQLKGGIVRIESFIKDEYHQLAVQNTGYLSGNSGSREGFGISSTIDRLNLLYGNRAKFEIKQLTPTLVEAKILIPLQAVS